MEQRILSLVLKKQWFDMIAKGIKKEEYRDIKTYYVSRFICDYDFVEEETGNIVTYGRFKDYDLVRFYLGYAKNRPSMDVEFKEIVQGKGKAEWGANPNKEYFVIRLGKVLQVNNYYQ